MLKKTKKRDPWFLDDHTLNPYSGCSFICLYCYIRGSKYGEQMQEKTSVKQNALPLREKQLASRAKRANMASKTASYKFYQKIFGRINISPTFAVY